MTTTRSIPGINGLDTLIPPVDPAKHPYFSDAIATHPFSPTATAFSWANAWWCAEASLLAYHAPAVAIDIFKVGGAKTVQGFSALGKIDAYVISNDDMIAVVFRGTQLEFDSLQIVYDWITNLDAWFSANDNFSGKAHRGFLKGALAMQSEIKGYLSNLQLTKQRPVWFTGHSQGGALAAISALLNENCQGVYTFGAPRVGNSEFANEFNKQAWRICNQSDPVPSSPPEFWDYRHVGNLVAFTSANSVHIGGETNTPAAYNVINHAPVAYSNLIWHQMTATRVAE